MHFMPLRPEALCAAYQSFSFEGMGTFEACLTPNSLDTSVLCESLLQCPLLKDTCPDPESSCRTDLNKPRY